MNHKIQMNPGMKSLRYNLIKNINNIDAVKSDLNPLIKQKKAEMIYRFHLAGAEIGKMCAIYGISPSYQRELKKLKEHEWQISLLDDDEEFINYFNGLRKTHPDIKEDSSEDLSSTMITLDYIFKGLSFKSSEYEHIFLELTKLMNEEGKLKNPPQNPQIADDAIHPCYISNPQKNKPISKLKKKRSDNT